MQSDRFNEYIKGCLVGVAETVVGHPLDTVKTRWQSPGRVAAFHGGLSGLYRGFSLPCIFNGTVSAVLFGVNGFGQRFTNNHFYTGALAGFATGLIIGPLDAYKVHRQQHMTTRLQWTRGLAATVARETPSMGVYFGLYNLFKDRGWSTGLNGGVTGVLTWWITYPFDLIKTRIQSDYQLKYIDACKIRPLELIDRAFWACTLRAMLVNAAGWWTYEHLTTLSA